MTPDRLHEQLSATDGVLVLEREAPGAFRPRGAIPQWLPRFVGSGDYAGAARAPGRIFPFLELFLDDAEAWWGQRREGDLRSEPWTESLPSGEPLRLEARACTVDGRSVLTVRHVAEFDRMQRVFQVGCDLSLAHERLIREIATKEILLHCIVHDLNGPLAGITGAFEILSTENLTADAKKFLSLGRHAARQQANFISDLLDTFRAEMSSPEALAADPAAAPDVVAAARSALAAAAPACELRKIAAELVLAPGVEAPVFVIAETNRLERIFHNLLQNAQRYSPRGKPLTVTIARQDAEVLVTVDDCGQGIAPEVVPQLFQKFVRGPGRTGKAGLGLYSCRITVESWGGAIGCEPRPEGGTRFWFRLKSAQPPAVKV